MTARRLISLVTLLSFLPLAVGCSSQKSIALDSNPGSEADPLRGGKSVRISGYTSTVNGYQEWSGAVRAAQSDSLQFSRRAGSTVHESRSLRLPRAEVISLSTTDTHFGRSVLLVFGCFVGMLGLAAALDPQGFMGY